jgi:hypothetical protein
MASDAEEVVADPAADQKCYVTGPCVRCDFDEEVINPFFLYCVLRLPNKAAAVL